MRIHILSVLLGITATLLAVAMFWPGVAPTTHAQSDTVLNLDRDWNNVAYTGDPLPVADALNDALDVTITVWLWRSFAGAWDSWTQGGPAIANSLARLDRGDIVWMRTSRAGAWTQIGATQAPGAAGLACWDLNGNGVFDPVTEDTVIDGVADALDCRGEPGLPGRAGRACWDANANGVPDPDEDVTGDGAANALDCQGTVGEISSVFLTTALTGVIEVVQTEIGPGVVISNAVCPANTLLTGGGDSVTSATNSDVWFSHPSGVGGNTWKVIARAVSGTITVQSYARCAQTGFVLGGVP